MMGMHYCDEANPTHWGPETGETLATYDDVDDMAGCVFNPPINARRQQITTMPGWEQRITVQCVDEDRLTLNVPNGTSPAAVVTCKAYHNGKEVCSMQWMAFDNDN
jgi:hypothetical protein